MRTETRTDPRPVGAPSRALPTWVGGLVALLLAYGAPLLAILSGYNEPPRSRTFLGVGLLVLSLLPVIAMTLAAPAYGLRRLKAFWRILWPVAGLALVWHLGIAAADAVNRSAQRARSS